MRLMISPQEFIRPAQDPMSYPEAFIKDCMGEDTNSNRKKLINALQLGVKQQGDVINALRMREKILSFASNTEVGNLAKVELN